MEALTELHDSRQWRAELRRHGRRGVFATGRAFESYLARRDRQVAALVRGLGQR
ncbi:hypothetical protein [Streptomyces coeruleorubidus]|uniref:hypothetical protein n=1 Tax=Streptomyces coeruleorubidus TaxID=116188 RepID=UPI0033B3C2C5